MIFLLMFLLIDLKMEETQTFICENQKVRILCLEVDQAVKWEMG